MTFIKHDPALFMTSFVLHNLERINMFLTGRIENELTGNVRAT